MLQLVLRRPLFSAHHRYFVRSNFPDPSRSLFSIRAFSTGRQTYQDRKDTLDSSNSRKIKGASKTKLAETLHENIYTIPNLLTVSRILACPVLGYYVVQENFVMATSLLAYAGLTDLVCFPSTLVLPVEPSILSLCVSRSTDG